MRRTSTTADPRALALAFAEAVNAEVRDLFAAGVDVVQLDEPWLQARADAAREFGVEATDRALDGAAGVTALHLCFRVRGQGARGQAKRYDFLGELDGCGVQQVSVEAAQPNLDLHSLQLLPSKIVVLGVLDLGQPGGGDAGDRCRARHPRRIAPPTAGAAGPRARLRHEVPAEAHGLRQTAGAREGRGHRPAGAGDLGGRRAFKGAATLSLGLLTQGDPV